MRVTAAATCGTHGLKGTSMGSVSGCKWPSQLEREERPVKGLLSQPPHDECIARGRVAGMMSEQTIFIRFYLRS